MNNEPTASIRKHYTGLEDPRIDGTKLHQPLGILVIAICALICGADDWVGVELFGNAKLAWLRTFLELPNGSPSHDTFGPVFARPNTEQFQACILAWIQAVSKVTRGQVIVIDGKVPQFSSTRQWSRTWVGPMSALVVRLVPWPSFALANRTDCRTRAASTRPRIAADGSPRRSLSM